MFEISKKIEKSVEAIVEPIIAGSGYEYVGTELKKTANALELIVYADKPGGLSLDDCETISRLIDPVIDAQDPIKDAYYLCVSSPGLDRALKEPSDFSRSAGKKVDIKLYRAIDGKKQFTGQLSRYDDDGFTVIIDGSETSFLYRDVALVKLHVDI